MNRTKIAQLYADADAFAGKTVTVAGWVKSVRDMKNFGFVTLNDGSCFKDLQVVMDRATLDAMLTAIREYLPHFRRYMRRRRSCWGIKMACRSTICSRRSGRTCTPIRWRKRAKCSSA